MSKVLALAVSDLACGVLLVAAVTKLADPRSFAAAMTSAGAGPARRWRPLARVVGLGEVAVALAAVVLGGRIGFGLLALTYAGFALVAAGIERNGGTCGCFGVRSAPVGRVHVGIDVGVAAVAAALAVLDARPMVDRLGPGFVSGAAYLGWVGVGTAASVALLTSARELALIVGRRRVAR